MEKDREPDEALPGRDERDDPREDEADEYEPCYADGSAKNECWKSD